MEIMIKLYCLLWEQKINGTGFQLFCQNKVYSVANDF